MWYSSWTPPNTLQKVGRHQKEAFRSPNYKKDMEYNDKYKKNEGIRNYLQNTTQKIKEWAMWTPLKLGFNLGVPEGLEYPAALVAFVVLHLIQNKVKGHGRTT